MCENNAESNADDDGIHQVYPNYGYFQCITRNCKKCGPDIGLNEYTQRESSNHG